MHYPFSEGIRRSKDLALLRSSQAIGKLGKAGGSHVLIMFAYFLSLCIHLTKLLENLGTADKILDRKTWK